MSEALLTVVEVAARLKCHPHTVRRWIWDRKMRAVKVGDLVRVPEQELAKFIRPVSEKPARRRSRQPRKGAMALVATMRRLRKKINPCESLPGAELIEAGLRDLSQGVESIPALLVSIGAPRLRRLGLPMPDPVFSSPELRLYQMLSRSNSDGAHSRYNSLLRRLVSFERALECAS